MHSILSSLLFSYKSLVIIKTTHLACILHILFCTDMDFGKRNNARSSQSTSRPPNALKRIVILVPCYCIDNKGKEGTWTHKALSKLTSERLSEVGDCRVLVSRGPDDMSGGCQAPCSPRFHLCGNKPQNTTSAS